MLLKLVIFITHIEHFILLCGLLSRALFSHGFFPSLSTGAVNCSSFELQHFILLVTGHYFKADGFCTFVFLLAYKP